MSEEKKYPAPTKEGGSKAYKFRALMYRGKFVDENKLHEGIYDTSSPKIYANTLTAAELFDKYELAQKYLGFTYSQIQEVKYHLSKCEMVDVYLSPNPTPSPDPTVLVQALKRIEKICLRDWINEEKAQKYFRDALNIVEEALNKYNNKKEEGI